MQSESFLCPDLSAPSQLQKVMGLEMRSGEMAHYRLNKKVCGNLMFIPLSWRETASPFDALMHSYSSPCFFISRI